MAGLAMHSLSLCLCGDVMTGRGIDQILPHPSDPALFEPWLRDAREYVHMAESLHGPIPRKVPFEYVWGDALEVLRGADARIVNLETSVTSGGEAWPDKGINYRMHPDNVSCLSAADIDVCVVANNHVLDWGRAALAETLDVLHGKGITTAGAGRNLDEARQAAIVDRGAGRLLVVGLATTSSGVPRSWAATSKRSGVALLHRDLEREADLVARRLASIRQPRDVVIASIHWGSNWGYEVDEGIVGFAHALVERGVDVVHGHSSHHPRPIEIHRGKLVLYGCGDFLDDYEAIQGHETYRGDLTIAYVTRLEPSTGRLLELRMVPMRLRKLRLERASREDAEWMSATLSRISAPYGTSVFVSDDGSLIARTERPAAGGA